MVIFLNIWRDAATNYSCSIRIWYNRTDSGKYPLGDSPALYFSRFDRTKAFVTQFLDVQDWEMQNELNLIVLDASGSPIFGKGWTELSSTPH